MATMDRNVSLVDPQQQGAEIIVSSADPGIESNHMDIIKAQQEQQLHHLLSPKPKRPLSVYNLFFQSERQKMLVVMPTRPQGKPARSHGKCSFSTMAKLIAKKWNEEDIDPEELELFNQIATTEKQRYQKEMKDYKVRRTMIFRKLEKSRKNNRCTTTTISSKNRAVTALGTTTSPPTPELSAQCLVYCHEQEALNIDLHPVCSLDEAGKVVAAATKPAASKSCMTTTTTQFIFSHLHRGIDELAGQLDDEDVDFLIQAFGD